MPNNLAAFKSLSENSIFKRFGFMRAIRILNLLLLAMVILAGSCGVDEEPAPAIGNISPEEGSFDMEVIITGSNFSMNAGENQVRFNGVDAEIIEIKKDTLKVKVPRDGSTGQVTVTINGFASLGPDFRYYDIYMTGSEESGTTTVARLWKNGIEIPLSNPVNAAALAITVSGSDTYVTGYQAATAGETFFPFGYWKNSDFIPIGDSEFIADASEAVVSSEFVYTAGSYYDTPFDPDGDFRPSSVRYWKNDVMQTAPEQEGYETGRTFAIGVSGSDVYLGGVVRDSEGAYTAYWKNGELEILGDNLEIRDLLVEGTDVHIVASGNDLSGNPLPMTYWKNGTSQTITGGTRLNEANAMVIDSADVYIIGNEMFPGSSVTGAKLWKNGSGSYIFDGEVESRGAGIALVEDHLFTGGYKLEGSKYRAYYTFDGQVVYVTNGENNVTVTGIFVQ